MTSYDEDEYDEYDDDEPPARILPDYLRQEGVDEAETLYRLIKECDGYDMHGRRL